MTFVRGLSILVFYVYQVSSSLHSKQFLQRGKVAICGAVANATQNLLPDTKPTEDRAENFIGRYDFLPGDGA